METITITTEYIKLQDLLKLAAVTATGGQAPHSGGASAGQRRGLHPAGKKAPPRRRRGG